MLGCVGWPRVGCVCGKVQSAAVQVRVKAGWGMLEEVG